MTDFRMVDAATIDMYQAIRIVRSAPRWRFRARMSWRSARAGVGPPHRKLPSHMHAAVDREVRARDETRVVRTEKRDERRDLIRLTEPANWNLRQDSGVHHVLGNRCGHRCRQVPGRHRVDRHTM